MNGEPHDIKTFAELPPDEFRLTAVNLKGARGLDDDALACFKNCKHIARLDLSETDAGDAGLKHFKDCAGLTALLLANCNKMTDAALVGLKDYPKLALLVLLAAPITDAGADHLKACLNLTELWVNTPKVTAGKAVQLQKALPKCRIVWAGGIIEPQPK